MSSSDVLRVVGDAHFCIATTTLLAVFGHRTRSWTFELVLGIHRVVDAGKPIRAE
ncbi:MAG: hypothetical protein ABIR16_06400 [Dokdonella sp.]